MSILKIMEDVARLIPEIARPYGLDALPLYQDGSLMNISETEDAIECALRVRRLHPFDPVLKVRLVLSGERLFALADRPPELAEYLKQEVVAARNVMLKHLRAMVERLEATP